MVAGLDDLSSPSKNASIPPFFALLENFHTSPLCPGITQWKGNSNRTK